jgi:hypothetical protein
MSEKNSDRQKVERSKQYPRTSLEDCVGYTKLVKTNLGKGAHDRESLARAIGFEKLSGAVTPKIASMVYFGFLDKVDGGYQLSEHTQKLTAALNEDETKEELREAFSRPTLYREILEKFKSEGQIPAQLATHLHRFHGITDAASENAADIFIESGRYAGVLDQSNQILSDGDLSRAGTRDESKTEDSAKGNQRDGALATQLEQQVKSIPGTQRFEFAITGGRNVVLIVPAEPNETDIKIIRKQIELLELQAGIEASNEVLPD